MGRFRRGNRIQEIEYQLKGSVRQNDIIFLDDMGNRQMGRPTSSTKTTETARQILT